VLSRGRDKLYSDFEKHAAAVRFLAYRDAMGESRPKYSETMSANLLRVGARGIGGSRGQT